MATQQTAIRGHGEVNSQTTAIYGKGDVILRLGNGGAGGTGLLEALAYDYLETLDQPASITWVINNSSNTQLALLRGYIDIALTYEREHEALAESEGWSITKGCLFHDHFVIAGPKSDPAGVAGSKSPAEALERIAKTRSIFHSRQDKSATTLKETSLWGERGLKPWTNENDADWYKTSTVTPAEALQNADAAGAYLVSDRSTLLRQTGLKTISQTTVFFEPQSPGDFLMNSCYALCSPAAAQDPSSWANRFFHYASSERGQAVIGAFGVNECGLPLFAPIKEEFARTYLAGGFPQDGKWVSRSRM